MQLLLLCVDMAIDTDADIDADLWCEWWTSFFGFIADLMTASMKCANSDEVGKNIKLKGIENANGK